MAKKITILTVLLVFLGLGPKIVSAATIKLSSGGQVVGDIVSEDATGVKVKVSSGTIFIERSIISQIARDESEYFDTADKLFDKKDYKGALLKYEEFLNLYPDSPSRQDALQKIFIIYDRTKDFKSFINNIQLYSQSISKKSAVYNKFISIFSEMYISEPELAPKVKSFLNERPELRKDFLDSIYALAKRCSVTAGVEKSCSIYSDLLSDFPEIIYAEDIYFDLANLYLNSIKYDQAILAYNKILSSFPNTRYKDNVLFNLAQAYLKKGDTEKGVEILKKLGADFKTGDFADKAGYLLIIEDASMTDKEKAEKIEAMILKSYDAKIVHDALRFLSEYYAKKGNIKEFIKFAQENINYAEPPAKVYFEYALSDAKLKYLKELIKNKSWEEYGRVKTDYEKFIKDTLDSIIRHSKDEDLLADSRFALWAFYDMLHKPEEKEVFEDLYEGLASLAKNANGVKRVRETADKFFKDSKYEYSKRLYFLYVDTLAEYLPTVACIGKFGELIEEFSSDSEFKMDILKEIIKRYFAVLKKINGPDEAAELLKEIARDNIKLNNCFVGKAIYETIMDNDPGLLYDKDLFDLGFCYEKLDNKTDAARQYAKISETYPDSSFLAEVNLKLARFYRENYDYKKALSYYKKIFKAKKINVNILTGAYDEAIPLVYLLEEDQVFYILTDLMARYTDTDLFVKVEYQLAYHYFSKRRYDDAKALFENIITNYPDTHFADGAKATLKLME